MTGSRLQVKITARRQSFLKMTTACDNHYHYMTSSASGQDGTESHAVIGYPSGQDGAILPAGDTDKGYCLVFYPI